MLRPISVLYGVCTVSCLVFPVNEEVVEMAVVVLLVDYSVAIPSAVEEVAEAAELGIRS